MKDEIKTSAPDPYSDRRPEREPMFEADPWR